MLVAAGAGLGAFVVFFAIWFFVPRGMGFGDVRLAGVIGVAVGYLGLLEAYLAFLVGFVLGLVFGLVLMVGSGSGRKTRIPFAPALCVGATVAILWGAPWSSTSSSVRLTRPRTVSHRDLRACRVDLTGCCAT